MHSSGFRRGSSLALVVLATALLIDASPAFAHERRRIGDLEVVVGWADEPALAGYTNAVQFSVEGPGAEEGELEVTVVFGEGVRGQPLPLEPAFDNPSEYLAPIIPTRPGTYTFEISGSVGAQAIDETFTSSENTFDDVRNPAELEFPEQDPTRGELAERLERLSQRETTGGASDGLARLLGGAALILALVAVAFALRRGASATP